MKNQIFLALFAILVGSNFATAKESPRKPASASWSCCANAAGVCAEGTDVSCERSSGDTVCSATDGQQGPATVEKSSPASRRITFHNSGKIYSACARPNND